MLVAAQAASAATTLTFDTTTTGATYTEAGLTITATSAEPVRTSSGAWRLDCCDGGPETFTLTTGGIFDLISVLRVHVDGSDPVVWKGFLNDVEIVSTSYNDGQGSDFLFSGFVGLDKVTMSVGGTWTDPGFDNLTFSASEVPEPASLALVAAGLLAAGVARRKKKNA